MNELTEAKIRYYYKPQEDLIIGGAVWVHMKQNHSGLSIFSAHVLVIEDI